MLSTSNYAARKYGVRAAMPGFIGRKLCPNLIIVPPNFSKYEAVSDQVRQVFSEYDPEHVSVSLDEAYLDLTDCLQWRREAGLESDPEKVVVELRAKIEERTKLTASAGIATNTMLAKVCSERKKPNGHWMLEPSREAIIQLLDTLPVRKVSGIGGVTEQLLSGALGVRTCTDLWKQRDLLPLLFSDNSCRHFLCVSLGLGSHHLASLLT